MTAAAKPSLRFHYSKKLHMKTLKVLNALDADDDPARYRADLADVVVELTKAGMSAYFLDALKLVEAGAVLQRTARFGLGAVVGMMTPMMRNAIGHMDNKQLRKISRFIRRLMEKR